MTPEDVARAAEAAHKVFKHRSWQYTDREGKHPSVPTSALLALTIARVARSARESFEASDDGFGQCSSGRFTVTIARDVEMGEIDTKISLDLATLSEPEPKP